MNGLPSRIVALFVLLASPLHLSAQSADDVINRHVAAIGGKHALSSIVTMRYVRTVFNTQDQVTTELSRRTFYSERPFYYRSEDPVSGRVSISDGWEMWNGTPTANHDSIEWQVASRVLQSRDLDFDRLFGSFIDYGSKGHRVEFKGTTEVEGVEVNIVRIAWKGGDEWDLYFAASSGLWSGYRISPESPVMHVTDYRKVGDVLIPHRNVTTEKLADGTTRIHERVFSDVTLNIPLSDSTFAPGRR
jgi:hypothetical protein